MRKKSTPVRYKPHEPIIPEDIILDNILPRLPVKSLFRFKCVSRSWLSTISSHEFHKTHLKFTSRYPQAFLLDYCYINESSNMITFDERNNFEEFIELEFDTPSMSNCTMVGSCDGLVCLYDEDLCFHLWNPTISEFVNVGAPDFDYDNKDYDLVGVGFGYVSSTDDYRIGCILTCDDDMCYVFMFSSSVGEWSLMGSVHFDGYIGRENESVLVDDTLYWSPYALKQGSNETHVVGLNLVNGQLNKFPLINFLIGYVRVNVHRMKRRLTLSCVKHYSDVTDVWVMKHLDDWNSWEKKFTINIKGSKLHCIFETGRCLVGWKDQLKLLDPFEVAPEQYQESTSVWQEIRRPNLRAKHGAWGYHESLISLETILPAVIEDDDQD